MDTIEILSKIKLATVPSIIGYGESYDNANELNWDEFFTMQFGILSSYEAYVNKILSVTTNIQDDMEVKVLTKIPIMPNLVDSFNRELNQVFNEKEESADIDYSDEELYAKLKDSVSFPQVEEVSSLSSYIEKYNVFISNLKGLAKELTTAISKSKAFLLSIQDEDKTDFTIKKQIPYYLSIVRVIRKYMIELVRFGEAFVRTLDD